MNQSNQKNIESSLRHELSKRCNRSEEILNKITEQLILRYSINHQYNPGFFKQDFNHVIQQLILYSDQTLSVLRKFQFLIQSASILGSIFNESFKLIYFLLKQVLNQKEKSRLNKSSKSVQNINCTNCGNIKQNQNIRYLREQLLSKKQLSNYYAKQKETFNYKRQFSQTQQNDLFNLEILNEDEIKKKLSKMELDHNLKQRDITICLEQLQRFNEKINGYSKFVEKDINKYVNFDVKDYVFKLGRHFYHNINHLETKIRQMKQNYCELSDKFCQTQDKIIDSKHYETLINNFNAEMGKHKSVIDQYSKQIRQKNNQLTERQQLISILENKIKQINQKQERQQNIQNLKITQLSHKNQFLGLKIQSMQALLKLTKNSNLLNYIQKGQGKHEIAQTNSEELIQIFSQINSNSQISKDDITEQQVNQKFQSLDSRLNLLHKRNMKMSNGRQDLKDVKLVNSIEDYHIGIKDLYEENQNLKQLLNKLSSQNKKIDNKLTIVSLISQQICSEKQNINSKKNITNLQKYIQQPGKYSKFEKLQFRERIKLGKISNFKKQNNQGQELAQQVISNHLLTKKNSKRFQSLNSVKNEQLKESQRTLKFDSNESNFTKTLNYRFQNEAIFPYQVNQNKIILNQYNKNQLKTKYKKRRHLSQQNSIEHQNREYPLKTSRKFGETQKIRKQNKQQSIKSFQSVSQHLKGLIYDLFENKTFKKVKKTFNSPLKKDQYKNLLTLQEINYSTYFFSLLANLRIKNHIAYWQLKQFIKFGKCQKMNTQAGHIISQKSSNIEENLTIKESIHQMIIKHRKCVKNGHLCNHLEQFIATIKTL